jgi:hypothetical protein
MSSSAPTSHMKKETKFFLFTDWSQTRADRKASGVEQWPLFAAANPKDTVTIKDVRTTINVRLDTRLNDLVDPADRVYFKHTNHGVELIRDDAATHWEYVQGAIVDTATASHAGNSDKLSALAKGLARKAPEYIRIKGEVLICLLPGSSAPLPPVFTSAHVLNVKRTGDSATLIGEVLTWLTTLNIQIEDDRLNAPQPLRDAVEEFIEKILI